MTNRRRIPLLLALALSSIAAWQMLRPREPIFQGIPESVWLDSLAYPYQSQVVEPQQWQALGPDAVPLLLKAVARKESPPHAAYVALWPKLPPWLKNRCPRPSDRSWRRVHALNLLFDLAHHTPIPVAPLLRALTDDDPYVRTAAASCLIVRAEAGNLGQQEERDVAAALMRAYQANTNSAVAWSTNSARAWPPQVGVRETVVIALGSLRNQTDITIPFLIKALGDPDTSVRSAATNALRRIGPITAYEAGIR